MANKNGVYSVHHRDVRKVEFETMNHRFAMEYYIPQNTDDLTAIIFFGPDARYVENSMYFPLIEMLFRFCRNAKIAASRVEFVTSPHYTEQEALLQYIIQANGSVENFKSLIGRYKKFIAVGISGGAYIALQMLLRRYEISGAVLISPHLLHYRFDELLVKYTNHLAVIHRPTDKYAPASLMEQFTNCANANGMKCSLKAIPATDDTYTHAEQKVWNEILDFIASIPDPEVVSPTIAA